MDRGLTSDEARARLRAIAEGTPRPTWAVLAPWVTLGTFVACGFLAARVPAVRRALLAAGRLVLQARRLGPPVAVGMEAARRARERALADGIAAWEANGHGTRTSG